MKIFLQGMVRPATQDIAHALEEKLSSFFRNPLPSQEAHVNPWKLSIIPNSTNSPQLGVHLVCHCHLHFWASVSFPRKGQDLNPYLTHQSLPDPVQFSRKNQWWKFGPSTPTSFVLAHGVLCLAVIKGSWEKIPMFHKLILWIKWHHWYWKKTQKPPNKQTKLKKPKHFVLLKQCTLLGTLLAHCLCQLLW